MNTQSHRRDFLRTAAALSAGAIVPNGLARRARGGQAEDAKTGRKPNFIIFFTDDQGYNDVGCFGSPLIRTPNFDRMAREGMKLTSFYAQPVCGPSRAALMTGSYPIRVGEPGNTKGQHTIVHPEEITIAEVLKSAGYATGLVGKWHLAGRRRSAYPAELMPYTQGFDSFFGTPLHNGFTRTVTARSFKAQLMRGDKILDDFLEQDEMDTLTQRYTKEAVAFIREHKDRPFFLYLAHNMPHVPLGASKDFRGKSKRGLYGDVIEELDWSAGQVLAALKECGVDEHTLVVFTSDNGPWIEGHLAGAGGNDRYYGSADPLRGNKMTTWDGGPRVPAIVRWPGKVPAGKVSDEIVTTMDLLPTFAGLAGAKLPEDRVLDGRDAWGVLSGKPGAKSPHEAYYFYCYTHLQAVRSGHWKLVLPRPAKPPWCGWSARMVDAVGEVQLYNLAADIGEKKNVAAENPDVVRRLTALIEKAREDLGDYDRVGKGARFFDDGPKRPDMNFWKRRGKGKAPTARTRPAAGPNTPTPADYQPVEPKGNLRFDFEAAGLGGWVVVEGEFAHLRTDRPNFHAAGNRAKYNKQGTYFLSTLERALEDGKHTARGDDSQTGVVESPVFVLKGQAASFLVGGGRGGNTYVALCTPDGKELLRASGSNSEIMRRVTWDTSKYVGRRVLLRVVDKSTAGWGHVTFDDFSAEAEIDKDATARRRKKP